MKNTVLIVVLDAPYPSLELMEKVEEIRRMPGVLGVRTIEAIAEDTAQPQYGSGKRSK